MHLNDCKPCNGMAGIGIWETVIGMGLTAAGKSGPAGSPAPGNVVSTSVTTTISPQISPQFIQQQSPTNSPVSAGITGALPGFDYASGFMPTGLPSLPVSFQQSGITPLAIAGIIGIGLLVMLASRKKRKGKR